MDNSAACSALPRLRGMAGRGQQRVLNILKRFFTGILT
jgi:hypothetical protein